MRWYLIIEQNQVFIVAMKLIVAVLVIILVSPLTYANTCTSFFNRDVASLSNFLDEARDERDLIVGQPHSAVYLEISPDFRLRYYDILPADLFPDVGVRPQLKLEARIDLGLMTRQEILLRAQQRPNEIIDIYRQQNGFYRVYKWIPRIDIPMDTKSGLIDANHKVGESLLKQVVDFAALRRPGQDGILFVDLNYLKIMNGSKRAHTAGNEYIEKTLEIIKSNLRLTGERNSSDIGFKVGGDEFVFIVRDVDFGSMDEISNRIHQQIAASMELKKLFDEPIQELRQLITRLKRIQSYHQLSENRSLLDFVQKTQAWMSLSQAAKQRARNNPAVFKQFIDSYVNSDEVDLRFRKMQAVKPGVSIGQKLIRQNSTYKKLYDSADRDMMKRKQAQKQIDLKDLPPGTYIPADIFTVLN